MRSTHDNLTGYWMVGSILIWLILPIGLLDLLIAPKWHAPHWQCDSLGIPVAGTAIAAIPWAIIASLISAFLVFLLVRKRVAGADIFSIRLGSPLWNCLVSPPVMAVIALATHDVGTHIWSAAFPQTISSDCGGQAELITLTMRGPIFQVLPLWEIAFALWVLHLRALLLSPRVKTPGRLRLGPGGSI